MVLSREEVEAMIQAESDCATCPHPCDVEVLEVSDSVRDRITKDEPLFGTVAPHKLHVVFTSGQSFTKWPANLDADPESFSSCINESLNKLVDSGDIQYKYRVSAMTRGPENGGDGEEETDLYLFPDHVKYCGIRREQLDDVFSYHLSNKVKNADKVGVSFPEAVPIEQDAFVFICGHKLRDNRCSIIGAVLRQQFEDVFEARGLVGKCDVDLVSHVGGHKFAGNLVIATKHEIGTVWYGRVFPEHVDNIVHSTIINGEVLKPLLRGLSKDW